MSYPIMSALPLSMAKGLHKTPKFNTVVQRNPAGMGNATTAIMPYPCWNFEFDLDHVTGNEAAATSVMASFLGTYIACQGQANLFLFTDPQDSSVTAMPFATGDGVAVSFQLSRSIGGTGIDVCQNINGTPAIYINGVRTYLFSMDDTGIITFSVAPTLGQILSWTGNFYYLCRFDEDTVDSTRSFTTNSGTDQWMFSGIKFSSEFVPQGTAGATVSGVVYENFNGGTF